MKPAFTFACISLLAMAQTVSIRGATVAYWRFEEGAANQAATGVGTILDSSGNGLDGTPINGPIYSAAVPADPIPQTGASDHLSLAFNSAAAQRVFIPDNPSFELTHSLTLEAYINPSASSSFLSQIVFRGDDRNALDPYWLATIDTGSAPQLVFTIDDAVGGEASLQAPLPSYNKWYHVAGTLNDATGLMDLYVNGQLVNSTTTTVRPLGPLDPTQRPGLGIGDVQSSTYGEYFNGLIDEVRISDQALRPAQFLDAVPEPSAWVLASLAAVGWGAVAVRRRLPRTI
jgi:MSHA biogenesis protein MshQ